MEGAATQKSAVRPLTETERKDLIAKARGRLPELTKQADVGLANLRRIAAGRLPR